MKYQVIGSNRQNGARMTLEFEAESKAAAERKATQAGMSVNRVQEISDGYPAYAQPPADFRRPKPRRNLLLPSIMLVLLAFVAFVMRTSILSLLQTIRGGR